MKYLVLMHVDPSVIESLSEEEQQAIVAGHRARAAPPGREHRRPRPGGPAGDVLRRGGRLTTPTVPEDLLRTFAPQVLGALLRRYGTSQFDLCEDAVQEALLAAHQQWPVRGNPENPRPAR